MSPSVAHVQYIGLQRISVSCDSLLVQHKINEAGLVRGIAQELDVMSHCEIRILKGFSYIPDEPINISE